MNYGNGNTVSWGRLFEIDLPCGAVMDIMEAVNYPHVAPGKMLIEVDDTFGSI